jgi:hypothetical protein
MSSYYCTIFDSAYLSRALALHESLLRASPSARLALFCVDDEASALLARMPLERALIVAHAAFGDGALKRARASRSRAEYCWTCKPFALLHLAAVAPDADWVVYVDTDMLFYGDPDSALPGPQSHYVITPHNFHPSFKMYAVTAGLHNAGYFAMRNSEQGRAVVRWWAERCIESCSVVSTDLIYADQKYLDRLATLFPFGGSSDHPGLNAGPWNIERYRLTSAVGVPLVDGMPLLLYHFQALRILSKSLVDLYAGNRRISLQARELIYRPYLDALRSACARLQRDLADDVPPPARALRSTKDWLRLAYGMARGYHNVELFRLPC